MEHLDTLTARTNNTVEMNTLTWISSMLDDLRRHSRFPRPESTAVDIMTVLPRAHSEAVMMIASSESGSFSSRCDLHRLMILAAVHRA